MIFTGKRFKDAGERLDSETQHELMLCTAEKNQNTYFTGFNERILLLYCDIMDCDNSVLDSSLFNYTINIFISMHLCYTETEVFAVSAFMKRYRHLELLLVSGKSESFAIYHQCSTKIRWIYLKKFLVDLNNSWFHFFHKSFPQTAVNSDFLVQFSLFWFNWVFKVVNVSRCVAFDTFSRYTRGAFHIAGARRHQFIFCFRLL